MTQRPIFESRPVAGVLLVLISLLVFLPGFFSLPVVDRDEGRFVQATKQMVQSGDWVDIRFREATRYKKPVGIYWLQASAIKLLGFDERASIWVYRLPSLLGSIAAVLLSYLLFCRFVAVRVAFGGALLLGLSLVIAGEARLAKTDAVLLACIVAAQFALAALYSTQLPGATTARPPRWIPWAFWLAIGASILVKGPIGPLVVGATVGVLAVLERPARWLRPLLHVPAIVAGVLVFLPWLIAISLRSQGAFFEQSIGEDFTQKILSGQEGHGAPPGTHTLLLLLTFWPGSALLVACIRGWRGVPRTPWGRFALAWAVPTWLLFELTPTKLLHYLLPIFPALALIAAQLWLGNPAPAAGRVERAIAGWVVMLGPALLAGLIVSAGLVGEATPLIALAALAASAALGLAAARSLWIGRKIAALWQLGLLAAVTYAGIFAAAGSRDHFWPSNAVVARLDAAKSSGEICTDPQLLNVGYDEPSLIWYTSKETARVTADQAAQALASGRCTVVIVESRFVAEVETSLRAASVNTRRIGEPIDGFAIGAGRSVTLQLLTR